MSRVLRPETARLMVTVHSTGERERFGLGFRIQHAGRFGKACSPATFGHTGSTGTVAWADPASGLICVLLTTLPAAESSEMLLRPVCDLVAEAV